MDFVITARNMEVTDAIRSHINRKFASVDRLLRDFDHPADGKVEIHREQTKAAQDQVVVQVTLNVNGTLLRAEERALTANAAVDVVSESIEKQFRRYKGRRYANLRAGKSGRDESIRTVDAPIEAAAPEDEEVVEAPSGAVVRVKRFPMKPVTVEEAAGQMEYLGHSFFFFLNSETHQYNVIYRRNDGDYTLIEPVAM